MECGPVQQWAARLPAIDGVEAADFNWESKAKIGSEVAPKGA
jgi:hypothetical protein